MKQISEDSRRWRKESLARDSEESQSGGGSGFLFASYIPDLVLVKPVALICQWTLVKPALLVKEQKRGSLANRKLLDNNCSTPAKDHRRIFSPTSTSTG